MTAAADAENHCWALARKTGRPLLMYMGEACFLARNGVNIPELVKGGAVHVISRRVGEATDMRPVEKAYARKR